MDDADPLAFLRQRANDLANTGRFSGWPEIEAVLGKAIHPLLLARIAKEVEFISMLDTRCRLAKRMRSG